MHRLKAGSHSNVIRWLGKPKYEASTDNFYCHKLGVIKLDLSHES